MPWDMKDYPSSLKNLPNVTKKKAIDIANALVEEGYDENRAIPIATEQAKEWHDNATKEERKEYMEKGDPTTHDSSYASRPDLLDRDVEVFQQGDEWSVKTETAKKASKVFPTKEEAVQYGKQVAKNKQTNLHIYRQDGSLEKTLSY